MGTGEGRHLWQIVTGGHRAGGLRGQGTAQGTVWEMMENHRPALTLGKLWVAVGKQPGEGEPPPAQQFRHVGRQGQGGILPGGCCGLHGVRGKGQAGGG